MDLHLLHSFIGVEQHVEILAVGAVRAKKGGCDFFEHAGARSSAFAAMRPV